MNLSKVLKKQQHDRESHDNDERYMGNEGTHMKNIQMYRETVQKPKEQQQNKK